MFAIHRGRHCTLRSALLVGLLLCAPLAPLPGQTSGEPPDPGSLQRLREVYVPYDEFKRYASKDPTGVIMDLREYRALVRKVFEREPLPPAPPLPPIETAIISASYRGTLSGKTVRLQATLKIRVSRSGWVRCDLGPPLPGMGRAILDGEPAWIVIDSGAIVSGRLVSGTSKGSIPRKTGKRSRSHPRERAFLFVRGLGEHTLEITYSLPAFERRDHWTLGGRLIKAASARLTLDVPGRALASSPTGTLTTESIEDRTRIVLALGSAGEFSIHWQRRQAETENQALISAEHRITVSPRQENPRFVWHCDASVFRREVESLLFTPPPQSTVLHVRGALLKSWEQVENGIRVFLKEATQGKIQLEFAGIFTDTGGRFTLSPPALDGAFSNRGYLGIISPPTQRVALESVNGMIELPPRELAMPVPGDDVSVMSASGTNAHSVQRLFSFSSPSASLTVQSTGYVPKTESHGTYLLQVTSDAVRLDGVIRLHVREGKVYQATLRLPDPWTLRVLEERVRSGPEHGVSYEEIGAQANRRLVINFARGIERGQQVELRLGFDHGTFATDTPWDRRVLSLPVPALLGIERGRTDLGVILPASMDTLTADLPGWRSLTAQETEQLGLTQGLLTPEFLAGREIVAGMTTRAAEPNATFTLVHRESRGEYQVVTHILALETGLRVRSDIRLVVVDRAIEELALRLPGEAGSNTVILGAGIREVDLNETTGLRTIRFRRPWLGTRHFRIEYETTRAPGTPGAFPVAELDDDFGKERFLVLQSRGAVEVDATPGPGLESIALDDIPEFSVAWAEGRLLKAYRYRLQGDPGTLRTLVHPRAPIVARLAQEMALTTIIGRQGISRTEVEILLGSPQAQYLEIGLPIDARVLAVRVGDRSLRALRPARATADRNIISVPLPPRSYSRIHVTYERPAGSPTSPARARDVGSWGTATWVEHGPQLIGTPVGKTTWRIYHPGGYRFVPTDGNLVVTRDTNWRDAPGNFWESFLLPLLSGGTPRLTFGETPLITPPHSPRVPPTSIEVTALQTASSPQNRLNARRTAPEAVNNEAPLSSMILEGHLIEAEKIGGNPRITISYWSHRWETAARRGVVGLTILGAIVLLRLISGFRRRALIFAYAFGFATFLPLALGWRSPLLMVPICEGLLLVGIWGSAAWLVRQVYSWTGRHRNSRTARTRRAAVRTTSPASCFVLGALTLLHAGGIVGGVARAQSQAMEPRETKSDWDGVLIPYEIGKEGTPEDVKVYVPRGKFTELWRAANHEPKLAEETPPAPYFTGSAEYDLHVDGDRTRIVGRIPVEILTDDWVALPLEFRHLRIVSLAIDGEVAGIHVERGVTHVPLQGRGKKLLSVELVGSVKSDLGAFRVRCGLGVIRAASLTAHLPLGALITLRGARHPGVIENGEDETRLIVDLGGVTEFEIMWSFPKLEREMGSRLESISYTGLEPTLDGVRVSRHELVQVTGRPVESLEYTVHGDWSIAEVIGDGISEWNVARAGEDPGDANATLTLRVFFGTPVKRADFRIRGHSSLDGQAPLPTLSLTDSTRQETYVGLNHSQRRRFLTGSLTGMSRVSGRELQRHFKLLDAAPDRLYQAYSSGAGEVVQLGPVGGETVLTTEAVAVVYSDRLVVFGRSRYNTAHPGVIRYELPLPQNWWIRSVKSAGLRFWEVLTTERGKRLVAHWSGGAKNGTEITWVAEERFDASPTRLALPALRTSGAGGAGTVRETVVWTFAAAREYDLSALESGRWESVPLQQAARDIELAPGVSYRFAVRSRRNDAATLVVGVTPKTSRLAATTVSFVRVAEDYLYVNTRLIYRVRFAGRDRFRFRLPQGAELMSLDTRNQQARSVQGTEIEIVLQSPLTGEHTVDLAYRILRGVEGQPRITPITLFDGGTVLEAVDAYVGVLQSGKAILTEASVSGLSPLEAEQIPFVPQGVASRNLQPAYRATALDWSLSLEEQEIEETAGVAAVAELAEITTVIAGDGTTRTEALYTLHNRTLQFLQLKLPPGAELWGVTLDGKPVAVGQLDDTTTEDGMTIEVPVEYVGSAHLDLEIGLRYEEPRLSLGGLLSRSVELRAPRVTNVEVRETLWTVRFPQGFEVWQSGGNMRRVTASAGYAKKVENLLEQQGKIIKIARDSQSRRLRTQARKELARLEQELGDNLAELEESYRSEASADRTQTPNQQDAPQQRARQGQLIRQAQKAQVDNRALRDDEGGGQRTAERSQVEQAFRDNAYFLQRGNWRGGRKNSGDSRIEASVTPPTPPDLADEAPFGGLRGLSMKQLVESEVHAQEEELAVKGGLPALKRTASLGALPGLEAPPEEIGGGIKLAFQRGDGDAEIVLSARREGSVARLTALVLIAFAIGLPLATMLLARRKRRQGA